MRSDVGAIAILKRGGDHQLYSGMENSGKWNQAALDHPSSEHGFR